MVYGGEWGIHLLGLEGPIWHLNTMHSAGSLSPVRGMDSGVSTHSTVRGETVSEKTRSVGGGWDGTQPVADADLLAANVGAWRSLTAHLGAPIR